MQGFHFFNCVNLLKLNLQHLVRFEGDKMIVNAIIVQNVFVVFKNTLLTLNANAIGLMLNYSIFIMIICPILSIVLQHVHTLLLFFDILVVDEAICILDDIASINTFLNDSRFYFMLCIFISSDTTRRAIQTTARTRSIQNILLCAGYNINTIATAGAINVNVLNNPPTDNINCGNKKKDKERQTRKQRQQQKKKKQREEILKKRDNNNNKSNQCCTLMCFILFLLLFILKFFCFFVLLCFDCSLLFLFSFFLFVLTCCLEKTIRLSDQHGPTTYKRIVGLFWLWNSLQIIPPPPPPP